MSKMATTAAVTVGLGAASVLAVGLAPASRAADPVKVGVVTPLSGSYAPIGKQVRWGAELAVKEINAAGGVGGRPFELLFEDEERSRCASPRSSCSRIRSICSPAP
jgi:branched-chain amino acid transport system substrate-binding protein